MAGATVNGVRLAGDLPSGQDFDGWVSTDEIALRVGDRICVAHQRWMTADQARRVADALHRLAPNPHPTT